MKVKRKLYPAVVSRRNLQDLCGITYRKAVVLELSYRKQFKKTEGQFLSVDEVSEGTGISVEQILKSLRRD